GLQTPCGVCGRGDDGRPCSVESAASSRSALLAAIVGELYTSRPHQTIRRTSNFTQLRMCGCVMICVARSLVPCAGRSFGIGPRVLAVSNLGGAMPRKILMFSLALGLLFAPTAVLAQNTVLQGVVRTETQQPVAGALIQIPALGPDT